MSGTTRKPASRKPSTTPNVETPAPDAPALALEVVDGASSGYVNHAVAQAVADALKDLPIGKTVLLPAGAVEVTHNSPHDYMQAIRNLLPDRGARYAPDAVAGDVAVAIVGTVTKSEGGVKRLGFRWRAPGKQQREIWVKGSGPQDRS